MLVGYVDFVMTNDSDKCQTELKHQDQSEVWSNYLIAEINMKLLTVVSLFIVDKLF